MTTAKPDGWLPGWITMAAVAAWVRDVDALLSFSRLRGIGGDLVAYAERRLPEIGILLQERHSDAEIEVQVRENVQTDGERLAYVGEHRSDRRDGVLWVRMPVARGRGRPNFAGLHPLRQRQAMAHMPCQVCGTTTVGSRADERYLFVGRDQGGQPLTEEERSIMPPVHATCALQSIKQCPHLRRGWTAALVDWAPSWGVSGTLYDPRTLPPLNSPKDPVRVPHTDLQRLRWTLASDDVVSLQGVEVIDLARLEAETRTARAPA